MKKKPPEHENLERWLVSYADFMTLLFAFFTTLYAISTVDAKKMGKMVMSMQAAFDPTGFSATKGSTDVTVGGSGQKDPARASMFFTAITAGATAAKGRGKGTGYAKKGDKGGEANGNGLGKIKEDLSRIIVDEALRDKVQIIVRKGGVVISLAEAGFFDSGSYQVRKKSLPLVDKIAAYIEKLPNPIRVTGHTDNQQVRGGRFASNWELSTARASHMVSYLLKKHKFEAGRLSAAGYAEFRPVAGNETPEGRARNRRVDIIIPTAASQQDADAL
jgi:chemotaxis protein MotB